MQGTDNVQNINMWSRRQRQMNIEEQKNGTARRNRGKIRGRHNSWYMYSSYKTGCVQLFCIVRIAICVCKTRICLLERMSSIGKLSCPNLYKLVAPDFQVGRPAGGDQSLRRNAVKGFVETQHLTQIFQRKIWWQWRWIVIWRGCTCQASECIVGKINIWYKAVEWQEYSLQLG